MALIWKIHNWRPRIITVGLITEPGNNVLTHIHITSECSDGKGIADSVIDYYYTKNLHLDKLLDICCCLGRRHNSNAKTKHFHASVVQFSIAELAKAENYFFLVMKQYDVELMKLLMLSG